jgi:hypothetical protein
MFRVGDKEGIPDENQVLYFEHYHCFEAKMVGATVQ